MERFIELDTADAAAGPDVMARPRTPRGSLVAAAFGALLAHTAFAYESTPEFQSLTEEEPEVFEGPERLGSEYPSDVLTYQKPLDWEFDWLSRRIAFDGAAGSTSALHFMTDLRLKAHGDLVAERLEFRATAVDDSDRERRSVHTVFELVGWPHRSVGLSVYGEPALDKRQADLGFAILFRPWPHHELRLFQTFVDLVRSERSDRPESFAPGGAPLARGLVGRAYRGEPNADREFLEYAVRWETPTRWLFEDVREYRYERVSVSLFGQKVLPRGLIVAGRAFVERKRESTAPLDGAETSMRDWTTDRLFILGRLIVPGWDGLRGWLFAPGAELALRQWIVDGRALAYRDLLPHLNVEIPGPTQAIVVSDRWLLGYEMTWHRQAGDFATALGDAWRGGPEEVDGILHHRLNTGYALRFDTLAEIRAMATWDPDLSTRGRIWQGGLVQMRVGY
ncbi:MAG TPA: hypothetical protein VE549_11390 [Myxococcaceae bacterium]|nr:hypothetical protein [Myxococcaceae bacterium]